MSFVVWYVIGVLVNILGFTTIKYIEKVNDTKYVNVNNDDIVFFSALSWVFLFAAILFSMIWGFFKMIDFTFKKLFNILGIDKNA